MTALGVLIIVSPYLSGRNQNQLFLVILLAAFLTVATVVRSTIGGSALLLATAIVAWFPADLPEVKLVDPGKVDRRDLLLEMIPVQRRWRYTFTLRDVGRLHPECNEHPESSAVYVDGIGLDDSGVEVGVEGTTWRKPPELRKKYALDQILLTPATDGVPEFSISLTAKPGGSPGIRLGPEPPGPFVFSDAVFLELKDPRCTIIYETRREVVVLP
jgi:hypothetical protein